jgi:MSHA biogenesis protein MshJ
MTLNQQMTRLREGFDARTPSEKTILTIVLLGAAAWAFLTYEFDPMQTERQQLQQEINGAQSRLVTMRNREQQAELRSREDPNRAAREQLQTLIAQEAEALRQLGELVGSVVAPVAMNRLLTNVLDLHPGLRLIRVENQAPRQLTGLAPTGEVTTAPAPAVRGRASQRVYSHGLLLEFEGDFLSTLDYLVYLETLSESFFWDTLLFIPVEWPAAHVILEIHTLSLEEAFVGV